MLAYRRSDFEALARSLEVRRWADGGFVDGPAGELLARKFPSPFYSPNPFIRIGLFLFGYICGGAALGLLFLMSGMGGSSGSIGTLLFIYAAGALGLQEIWARKPKPFFRAGVEEAMTYSGLAAAIAAVLILSRFHGDVHAGLALALAAVFALAAMRYADSLLALASMAAVFFALFDVGGRYGERALFLLPPAALAISVCIVIAASWALRQASMAPWEHVWKLLRFAGLLTAYAGGNYFVVREAGSAMLHASVTEGSDIALAPLFYAYTFAMPLVYLAYGLMRKDRQFLDAGLAIFAAAVFTYKRYHNVMSVEMGLTLAGFALIAVAWAALKGFKASKPARFGICSAPVPRARCRAPRARRSAPPARPSVRPRRRRWSP